MRRGLVIVALVASTALAACGTTVDLAHQSARGVGVDAPDAGGGLSLPPGSTTATGSTPLSVGPIAGSSASGPATRVGAAPAPVTPSGNTSGAPSSGAATDTAPIELGFLDTEVSNASAFGASAGTTFSSAAAAQAIVDAFNAVGGMDGRKITAVIARTDTASASWETDYSAACAKFTQDNHVAAVLGYSFAFLDSFESCLTKAGILHLDDGYSTGDAYAQKQYPMHFSLSNPTNDRHYLEQLSGPFGSGYITKASKLGLMITSCPSDQRAWAAGGLPFVKAHGLDLAAVETLDCVSGANGDAAAVSEVSSAVLKFRSAGVDRVLAEGVPAILLAVAASPQGWHPGYVVTSWTGGSAVEGSGLMPADQAPNLHGFGWLPIADVDTSHAPAPNSPQRRCLALYKSKGLVPHQYNDYITAYEFCDAMFLYEAALQRTSGHSDSHVVAQAIESMGSSYVSPTTLDGATRFSPTRHDAPTMAAPWGWNGSCRCYVYQGPAQPMP